MPYLGTMQEGMRASRCEAWCPVSVAAQRGFGMEAGPLRCVTIVDHLKSWFIWNFGELKGRITFNIPSNYDASGK